MNERQNNGLGKRSVETLQMVRQTTLRRLDGKRSRNMREHRKVRFVRQTYSECAPIIRMRFGDQLAKIVVITESGDETRVYESSPRLSSKL
jgi:hypothetical protein